MAVCHPRWVGALHFVYSQFLYDHVSPPLYLSHYNRIKLITCLLCARCYPKRFVNIGAEVGRLDSVPSSVTQACGFVKKLSVSLSFIIYKLEVIAFVLSL